MKASELEARECIRDLVARYNACGDAGRFDEMLDLFHEDATLELPGRRCEGRDAIRGYFESVVHGAGEAPTRVFHHTATLQIDVESETDARGRCYYQVLTAEGLDHWGRYVDRFSRRDGRWRFAARRVSLDGALPGGWGDRRLQSIGVTGG